MLRQCAFAASIFLGASITSSGQLAIDWNLSLGGSNTDMPSQVVSTPDGGSLIVGRSSSDDLDFDAGLGNADGVVLKMSSSGEVEWLKHYGGSQDDSLEDVAALSDGSFIVAGKSQSDDGDLAINHGSYDFWILKLTAEGDILWSLSFGGSNDDMAKAVTITQDGGIAVIGKSQSGDGDVSVNYGWHDIWILKLSADGVLEWEKTLGGSSYDDPSDVLELADGGFMVLAGTESSDFDVSTNYSGQSGDGEDCWVVKLDESGQIVWEKSFGGSGEDSPDELIQSDDGNYLICGRTSSQDFDIAEANGSNDGWILKIDDQAQLIWSKAFGGSETDWIRAIEKAPEGGYFFTGYSQSDDGMVPGNYGGHDCWIGHLTEEGQLLWSQNFGGSSDDRSSSLSIQEDGKILVAGYSTSADIDVVNNNGGYDYWLAGLISDETQSVRAPDSPPLFTFHPNPTMDGQLQVHGLDFSQGEFTSELVSLTGVRVNVDMNSVNSTNGECTLHLGDFTPGIYLLRIEQQGIWATRKVIIH